MTPPSASIVFIFCAAMICSSSLAAPTQDIFSGFLRDVYLNSPTKEREVVKRRVDTENPDSELKQVGLSALIGDLESSLYQTAMSVSGVAHDNGAFVPEITPDSSNQQLSRSNEQQPTDSATEPPHVVLQTTAKVAGRPGNILIDRIAVQPYFGGIPIIPAFQVQHSKLLREGTNATTQISITKKTLNTVPATIVTEITQTTSDVESSSAAATTADAAKSSTTTSSTTDTTSSTTTVPTMNKAEAELKEKVAEIEAEPVILSARI